MAKQRFTLPTTNNTIRNTITDADENELDTFISEQKTEAMPDGSISTEKTTFSKIIADGSAYNPAMSMGSRPERVGSCYFCERQARSNPGKSSLVNLRYARFCERCGRLGCLHCVRRRKDGKFYCRGCNIKNHAKRAVRRFFFRLEYEE